MQTKSKFLFSIFRFTSYTVFLLVLLLTDNVFNYSDSKIVSIFMLFSFSFEFIVAGINSSCKKVWAAILCILIIGTGAFLIEKSARYEKAPKVLIKVSDLTPQN